MCGISGVFGSSSPDAIIAPMIDVQQHRGPDFADSFIDRPGAAALGHNRLSILDLSPAGRQPMVSRDGRYWIVFNGELYNFLELRAELADYPYRSRSDTEVVLAAYERWGAAMLDRFIGMFAFLIWDTREQRLFGARDRFGVKPMYYHRREDGSLLVASEIKGIHRAGTPAEPDDASWASYFVHGVHDAGDRTLWSGIRALPGGHSLTWHAGRLRIAKWYDLAERCGMELDERPMADVEEEYSALLTDSVRLRFRSDVPVGVNLSGGVDSSLLLGVIDSLQGPESEVKAFTFVTGDAAYDELPWVRSMLRQTKHESITCLLEANDVPELADSVQLLQDEPFGGIPTLAYARVFERARREGVIVLLDGQGLDEQWAGYDYYENATPRRAVSVVQGTSDRPVRPECLVDAFRSIAEAPSASSPFPDVLRNLQLRDSCYTKLPRALRFNDRVSMRSSVELREPFLDHRLFELAFRQRPDRKRRDGVGKWLLRRIAERTVPQHVVTAPKRPLQTPQREWLRGPLQAWATRHIEIALDEYGGVWFDADRVRSAWRSYCGGGSDNSYYVWQWVSLGLITKLWSARMTA
jgi:asparagine synthase (glutamine-hydrolysing)